MKSFLPRCLQLFGASGASGAAAYVACASPAFAQQPPTVKTDNTAALPPIRLPNTPNLTDKLPYTQWTRHLGPAAEALVTAEVTLKDTRTQESSTQSGAGLIVRCDGLVLLPASLFHLPENDGIRKTEKVVAITLRRVTAPTPQGAKAASGARGGALPESAESAESFSAEPPRYRSPQAPFVLVKTTDKSNKSNKFNRHFRAASLLHPRNLEVGRKVEIVYLQDSPVDGKTGLDVLAVRRRKAQVTDKEGVSTLTFGPADASSMPRLPTGAIVIDTESNMAIGMYVPPEATPVSGISGDEPSDSSLTTFARLHDVTNATGLVPAPDDRLGQAPQARKAGDVQDGMVWIPGGPLEINPAEWPELAGAAVACTPGFWIDRTEVTVREYRKFLRETKYRPLPKGWKEADVTAEIPQIAAAEPGVKEGPDSLPVRGVSPPDAEAYAAWAGKRLVTPTEWAWATRGAGLAPVQSVTVAPLIVIDRTNPRNAGPRDNWGLWVGTGGTRVVLHPLNDWVKTASPPWAVAYERVLGEAELALRMTALVAAYGEARFWGYWQNPTGDHLNLWELPVARSVFEAPEFLSAVSYMTPSRAVADPRPLRQRPPLPDNSLQFDWIHGYLGIETRKTGVEDTKGMIQDMFDPLLIAPVGSRAFDRSVFDVRDVSTNLPEWLQENRAVAPSERAMKPLPALFDPVAQPDWEDMFDAEIVRRLMQFNVSLNGGDRFRFSAVRSYVVFKEQYDAQGRKLPPPPDEDHGPYNIVQQQSQGRLTGAGAELEWINMDATARNVSRYPTPLLPFLRLSQPGTAPDIGTGFRCAR